MHAELRQAIVSHQVAQLKKLLNHPDATADMVNQLDASGEGLLHLACQQRHHAVVQGLLSVPGLNLNLKTAKGQSAMGIALEKEDDFMLFRLLGDPRTELGEDVRDRFPSLQRACFDGELSSVRVLLERDSSLVNQQGPLGLTALMVAGCRGAADVVRYLLAQGAKLQQFTNGGRSPLYFASFAGQRTVVEVLLERARALGCGREVLQQAKWNGRTALHDASWRGHWEVVEVLLAAAEAMGCERELLQQADEDGWTALHVVSAAGHREVMEVLLARARALGCERELLQQLGEHGETALHAAGWRGHREVVAHLLERAAALGCERELLQQSGEHGEIALHAASHGGCREVVAHLLERAGALGCEHEVLQQADKEGRTALHVASRCNKQEVVKVLLGRSEALDCEREVLSKALESHEEAAPAAPRTLGKRPACDAPDRTLKRQKADARGSSSLIAPRAVACPPARPEDEASDAVSDVRSESGSVASSF